ncbi:RPA190 [Symbiodinium microadriaticum]|nr:RPA190 [Symbiodinium microadriaticum]CAE7948226.1 RPA190 [Symbiodinium sp. KB8]
MDAATPYDFSGSSCSREATQVRFMYFSPEEIKSLSTVEVNDVSTFDEWGVPVRGGLHSLEMGPIADCKHSSMVCQTCGLDRDCPGHLGHIQLAAPLFNPFMMNNLLQLLRQTCYKCHKFKCREALTEAFVRQLEQLSPGEIPEPRYQAASKAGLLSEISPDPADIVFRVEEITRDGTTTTREVRKAQDLKQTKQAAEKLVADLDAKRAEQDAAAVAARAGQSKGAHGPQVSSSLEAIRQVIRDFNTNLPTSCARCQAQAKWRREGFEALFVTQKGGKEQLAIPEYARDLLRALWKNEARALRNRSMLRPFGKPDPHAKARAIQKHLACLWGIPLSAYQKQELAQSLRPFDTQMQQETSYCKDCVHHPDPAMTAQDRSQSPTWVRRTLGPMRRGSLRGSIFTLMSAAIGSGVLLLPYAFSLVGLPLGLLTLFFGTYCLATSLRLIMTISHITGCDSYAKSAAAVLGPSAGRALACLMVGEALCGQASFIKFLSDLLPRVLPSVFGGFSKPQMAVIVVCLAFPASACRDLSVLRHVTMISFFSLAFMATLVVSGALGGPVLDDEHMEVIMHGRGTSTLHVLPQTWSIVLSALYCQHVAIPVYRQLHNSDSRRVNKVLLRSCTALSVMYAVVASCGIVAHGAATPENILLAYPKDHRAASLAQLLTGCSLLVALPLGVQPARDQFPEVLRAWRALFQALARFCRNGVLMLLRRPRSTVVMMLFPAVAASLPRDDYRKGILSAAASLAVVFPSVTAIVGIATGFGSVLWTFIMPVVMILILRHRAGKERCLIEGPGSGIRERLLSSPLSSPPMSPCPSPRFSPTPSIPEIPPMTLNEEEPEMCMHIDEPDSGKRSTVVFTGKTREEEGSDVYSPPHKRNIPDHYEHYPWSFHFVVGVFSLCIGSGLGLTAAYQSLRRVLG